MKVNFEIKENIYIQYNDTLYDLHNEYDFIKYIFDIEKNSVTLYFKSISSEEIILLKHSSIIYFNSFKKIENNSIVIEDSNTLANISFFESLDRDTNDSINIRKIPNVDDDIIYFFENEDFIRLKSKSIEFLSEDTK